MGSSEIRCPCTFCNRHDGRLSIRRKVFDVLKDKLCFYISTIHTHTHTPTHKSPTDLRFQRFAARHTMLQFHMRNGRSFRALGWATFSLLMETFKARLFLKQRRSHDIAQVDRICERTGRATSAQQRNSTESLLSIDICSPVPRQHTLRICTHFRRTQYYRHSSIERLWYYLKGHLTGRNKDIEEIEIVSSSSYILWKSDVF